jgi:predicted metalloprotease with PDZ domain
MWLRADTLIREQTHDRLTLDDFLRSFLGQRDTGPIVVPYTRADVETALAAICPYDWHSFFEKYVYRVNAAPPMEGLEAAGWRVVYNATPNNKPFYADLPDAPSYFSTASIGIDLRNDGTIADVFPGAPAYDAGLGPGMKVVAVDGNAYSPEALSASIAHPRNGKISLIVRNFDTVETREIQYAGGLRYPHLERIPGTHDYLTEILTPRSNPGQ